MKEKFNVPSRNILQGISTDCQPQITINHLILRYYSIYITVGFCSIWNEHNIIENTPPWQEYLPI
jgi:hypothetical protein